MVGSQVIGADDFIVAVAGGSEGKAICVEAKMEVVEPVGRIGGRNIFFQGLETVGVGISCIGGQAMVFQPCKGDGIRGLQKGSGDSDISDLTVESVSDG